MWRFQILALIGRLLADCDDLYKALSTEKETKQNNANNPDIKKLKKIFLMDQIRIQIKTNEILNQN